MAKIPDKLCSNVLFFKVTERFEGLINQRSRSDHFPTLASTVNKYFLRAVWCNVRSPARAGTKSLGREYVPWLFFTAINFGSIDLGFFLQPTSSSLADSPVRAPCCSWAWGRMCPYCIAWSGIGNSSDSNIYLPVILYNITASFGAGVRPFSPNSRWVPI